MHMEHRLAQTQTQRLMLTQKMQQAIQILQLSGLELEQYLQQELESNPTLEQLPQQTEPEPDQENDPNNDESELFDDVAFDLDKYASHWSDRAEEGRDMSYNPDLADRRQYYENCITKQESFTAYLLNQLRLAAKDETDYALGERIIGDISDKGYFTGSLDEIAAEMGVSGEAVERALALVQRLEPTGVGARDVVECLLIQIHVEYPDEEDLRILVSEHLEELERRQIPQIAKAMRITAERVEELKNMLATLNPWPGFEYASEPPQYVTPDVIVDKVDDGFVVYLSDDTAPQLRTSSHYRDMIKGGKISQDEKRYIRERLEAAKWLIRNIEQRRQTILRIGQAIAEFQDEFMEKGIEKIRPLTLQTVADKVGVHEATVSRATRGKYMQTPQGLFEMKFFFSPGLRRDTGEAQSSKSVQSVIKKIIDEEDKTKPLSDQKIADRLKGQGLNIARRTVTKYREALGIPATPLRKKYE